MDLINKQLIKQAEKVAEDLRDFIQAGIESGCDMRESQQLLQDWEEILARHKKLQRERAGIQTVHFGDARDLNLDIFEHGGEA